jgi:hypothetical protein
VFKAVLAESDITALLHGVYPPSAFSMMLRDAIQGAAMKGRVRDTAAAASSRPAPPGLAGTYSTAAEATALTLRALKAVGAELSEKDSPLEGDCLIILLQVRISDYELVWMRHNTHAGP